MQKAQLAFGKRLAQPVMLNPTFTSDLSPTESQRNERMSAILREKNFRGTDVTRVELPGDTDKSQPQRTAQFWRQSAMPWNNSRMYTPTDAQRLNNQGQAYMHQQPQLTVPSTSSQFHAFMQALSALFGNLQNG